MCPPAAFAPVDELNEYWTEEEVCRSLMKFKSGCPLPSNVISDVNPYQCRPSNLPDIWYFCSGVKKDGENGFWRATGEACEIFSNSSIIGWRNTLQFYEGLAPHGQKTNWMMQEYTTTEKCSGKLDSRALCRVFLADENRLVHPELPPYAADIGVTDAIISGPNIASDTKHSSGQLSKSELLEKNMDDGTGPSAMAKRSPDPPVENFPDMDYVVMGDYLELNDLADPLSSSSSSPDSSCMTMTSEELFDSAALLRELGDDTAGQEMKDSSIKFNLSVSAKSKEVVMHPTTLGSIKSGEECPPSMGQTSKADHTPHNGPGDHTNESASNGHDTASSSGSGGTSKEEKKDRSSRTKKRKMMKYLCFMAF